MNRLNQFWKVSFICNICQKKFEKSIVYSPDPNLEQLKETYCADCAKIIEKELESCSFREIDDKTKQYTLCDKPLFDKKKQLCRFHNKQVWKRFNEFTKDKSVSSTAAWLETWDQSRDWRYFWNLGNESEKKLPPETKKAKKDFGTPPIEATENLRSLEIDKRTLRKTGRIKQFNTSVSEEWMEKLKFIAYEERLRYVEVLEKALECYEKHRKK